MQLNGHWKCFFVLFQSTYGTMGKYSPFPRNSGRRLSFSPSKHLRNELTQQQQFHSQYKSLWNFFSFSYENDVNNWHNIYSQITPVFSVLWYYQYYSWIFFFFYFRMPWIVGSLPCCIWSLCACLFSNSGWITALPTVFKELSNSSLLSLLCANLLHCWSCHAF